MSSSGSPPRITVPTSITPFVNEQRVINDPWLRFLITIWQSLGSGQVSPANGAYLVVSPSGAIDVYESARNSRVGSILFVPTAGGAEEVLVLGASPFVFAAGGLGNLLVGSGKVEISRSGGAFRQIGLVGGYFFLEPGDSIRVSWFGAIAPEVVWYSFT